MGVCKELPPIFKTLFKQLLRGEESIHDERSAMDGLLSPTSRPAARAPNRESSPLQGRVANMTYDHHMEFMQHLLQQR